MIKALESYIVSNKLFSKKDKLLVATSGGVDSVVLCTLLSKANFNISIAHCNFQLRGEDSDNDEILVGNLAKELNVPFYNKNFDTKSYAETNKISTQLAARELRYDWFYKLVQKNNYDYLLTAHHASDQTETVIYNLVKGTGISGLKGIPIINEQIRRPLIFATKVEIIEYASFNNLKWREDFSNSDNKYSRNLIRNQVIPQLKNINPNLDETMLRNIYRMQSIDTFIQSEVLKIKSIHLDNYNQQQILALEWLTNSNQIIIHKILNDFGFNFFQVEDILTSKSKSGKVFYSSNKKLTIDRNKLIIEPKMETDFKKILVSKSDLLINTPFNQFYISINKKSDIVFSNDNRIACLDAEKVKFPFTIRSWEQGDRFIPLGMKSEKKLSDFMIDEKIPVNLKKLLPIFESNGNIFWIAGHRIDNRFKVTSNTKSVLTIKQETKDV